MENVLSNVTWKVIFDEDDLAARKFAAVARSGSLKKVSRQFGVRVDKLRDELTLLESRVGYKLFVRNKSILELTPVGRRIYALLHASTLSGLNVASATIKISVSPLLLDGFLLRPLISWLRKSAGEKVVTLIPDCPYEDDADIRVWLSQPGEVSSLNQHVAGKRLAPLPFMPFIASSYASKLILPHCLDDLNDYMLIHYQGYQEYPALDPWNHFIAHRRHSVMHVSSYTAAKELIRWAGVIGLLPAQLPQFNSNFLPLPDLFPQLMALDVWIGLTLRAEREPEICRVFKLFEAGLLNAINENNSR